MSEFDDRVRQTLREIVATAPDPPPLVPHVGRRSGRRPVRVIAATVLVLVAVAVMVVVALVADRPAVSSHVVVRPVPTTATPGATVKGPGPAGFPAPLGPIQDSSAETGGVGGEGVNGVVVHLVVDADGVTGGKTIHGHLQVINRTRHALKGGRVCRADVVAAVIYGGRFPERPMFPAASCAQAFAFRVGVTTLPFSVSIDYESSSGLRPLPTGYYHVGVVVHGPRIPVPGPVTVIVLPAGT
jgi:hypothetical protein